MTALINMWKSLPFENTETEIVFFGVEIPREDFMLPVSLWWGEVLLYYYVFAVERKNWKIRQDW